MDNVSYRWVDGPTATQTDWEAFEMACVARGWEIPNRALVRLCVAECDGVIVGFLATSLLLHVGPLFISNEMRGRGIAEELSDRMYEFTNNVWQRGFMVVAESPHSARIARQHGMFKIEHDVYVKLPAPDDGQGQE